MVDTGKPAHGDVPEVGATIRHASAVLGFPAISGVTTLYELFRSSVEKHAERKCLGLRTPQGPYDYLTYKQVLGMLRMISPSWWLVQPLPPSWAHRQGQGACYCSVYHCWAPTRGYGCCWQAARRHMASTHTVVYASQVGWVSTVPTALNGPLHNMLSTACQAVSVCAGVC